MVIGEGFSSRLYKKGLYPSGYKVFGSYVQRGVWWFAFLGFSRFLFCLSLLNVGAVGGFLVGFVVFWFCGV